MDRQMKKIGNGQIDEKDSKWIERFKIKKIAN